MQPPSSLYSFQHFLWYNESMEWEVTIAVILLGLVLGATLGSFACCQVRRMRRKEKGEKKLGKWSVCEHCGHKLAWYENIPIISWFALRGKCKKCKQKIGVMELTSEIGLAIIFVVLALVFARMTDWLAAVTLEALIASAFFTVIMTLMWMIASYDMKWGKMPTVLLIATVILALWMRIWALITSGPALQADLLNLVGALLVLPALYFALYFFSKEKLVGGGDWILALAIALILGDWWLAFFVLFISNALASIVAVFLIIKDRKVHKKAKMSKEMTMKIPFGPYLVLALVIVIALEPWISRMLVKF